MTKDTTKIVEELGLGEQWGTPDLPEDTASLWLSMPIAEEFEKRLNAYCLERERLEVERIFSEHAIAAQIVYEFEDMVVDPHMAARGDFVEWETADGQMFKGLSPMPRFEQTPGQIWRPMPSIGGDTMDVLTKLGYSEDEVRALAEKGVVRLGE